MSDPPAEPICGVQEGSRRGWIFVCVLPRGHPRTHPVKHRMEWIKGHPDADPNGPGPDVDDAPLPRRRPDPARPAVPTRPENDPEVARWPRRGRRAEQHPGPPWDGGPVPGSRSEGDAWRRAVAAGAWTGPRGSDDSDEPDQDHEEIARRRHKGPGVGGPTGEASMSASELIGAIEAVIGSIREEVQASVRHTADVIDDNVSRVQGLSGSGEVAAVHRALAALQEAAQHLEEAIQPTEAAIEHLAAWSVAIQQAHG